MMAGQILVWEALDLEYVREKFTDGNRRKRKHKSTNCLDFHTDQQQMVENFPFSALQSVCLSLSLSLSVSSRKDDFP